MNAGRSIAAATAGALLLGAVAIGMPATWAQEATPEAAVAMPPRPAHIHTGNCNNLGDVVQPLTDLTGATGANVGQARRAIPAESSYTNVPMTLDAILGADHAINVHLSAEEIGTYIACGDLGGSLTAEGALIVGLAELNNSGYTGIAFLAPGTDGASTDVSAFIAPTQQRREREREAEATPAVGGAAETPASEGVSGTPAAGEETMGTPAAAASDEGLVAGEQVAVSEVEFAIQMPSTLPAGTVTFAVTNDGTITHSFEIEGNGIEEELEAPLAPGETGMLTVDLAPGTYEVYCPIGNHEDQGMRLDVTVA